MTSDHDEPFGQQPDDDLPVSRDEMARAYRHLLARVEQLEAEVQHLAALQRVTGGEPDDDPYAPSGDDPYSHPVEEPSDDPMAPRPPRQEPSLGSPADSSPTSDRRAERYGATPLQSEPAAADDGWESPDTDDLAQAPPPPLPQRRRGGGRAFVWLLVLALIGGGVWVALDEGGVGTLRDEVIAELRLLAGMEPAAPPPAPAPAPTPAPVQTPAEQDAIAEGLEETFEAAEAEEAAAEDAEVEAEEAEAEPVPERPDRALAPGQGPAVSAAPRGDVQVAALGSDEIAPLPADAPAQVRDIARLALDGNAEAQHDLATLYAMGTSIPQNYERAVYWYGRSAEGGVANSLYNLGVLTERGLGTPQDSRGAFAYFLRAAEDDHPDAQFAVGLAYANGRGTEVNLLRAATWFQAASSAGNPRGAYHMGRLFEQGLDGAPDMAAAAGWYRIAANAGDADAAAALERVSAAEASPSPAPVSNGVAAPAATPTPAAPVDDRDLTRDELREVQQRLTELGFDPGPADGLMGARTAAAIEQFQRAQNAEPTGRPSTGLLILLRAVLDADNG